jgi:hypothetical protein
MEIYYHPEVLFRTKPFDQIGALCLVISYLYFLSSITIPGYLLPSLFILICIYQWHHTLPLRHVRLFMCSNIVLIMEWRHIVSQVQLLSSSYIVEILLISNAITLVHMASIWYTKGSFDKLSLLIFLICVFMVLFLNFCTFSFIDTITFLLLMKKHEKHIIQYRSGLFKNYYLVLLSSVLVVKLFIPYAITMRTILSLQNKQIPNYFLPDISLKKSIELVRKSIKAQSSFHIWWFAFCTWYPLILLSDHFGNMYLFHICSVLPHILLKNFSLSCDDYDGAVKLLQKMNDIQFISQELQVHKLVQEIDKIIIDFLF